MARTPRDVTEAELAVLQVLWDQGPATVRHLADTLYPGGTSSQYATVQKLLDRLEGKHYVQRNRESWPHVFHAIVDRTELIGRRLQTTANELCNGSIEPLLTHLVRSKSLTAEDRESLRGLLDELDQKSKRKGK